jgi:putative ABC transport system ATP-binding protein
VKIMEDLHGQGLTLVVVTHDPAIGGRAHRRLRMRDGRIVEDVHG